MTPETLRELRESRGLTRDELALELGCSAGAIVQWELDKRKIPPWVEERMMRAIEVKLPLAQLAAFIDHCRDNGLDFHAALHQALGQWITTHSTSETPPKSVANPQSTYGPKAYPPQKAAEEPPAAGINNPSAKTA